MMEINQKPKTIEEAKQIWPEIPLGRCKDYTNETYCKLTYLYRTNNVGINTKWVAKCECGNYAVVKVHDTKSCGCMGAHNLTGQKFGKLTVLSQAKSRNGRTYWLCECECGNQKEIQGSHLISGATKSCGCLGQQCNPNKEKFKNCLNCGKKLVRGQYKYCSLTCQKEYQRKKDVEKIFNGEKSGLKNATTSSPKIRDSLRNYLLQKNNYSCEQCGCNWINPYSNQTILEIHHIDGDRTNNLEDNLQVLCPNCHAMTPNYKGLNIRKRDT